MRAQNAYSITEVALASIDDGTVNRRRYISTWPMNRLTLRRRCWRLSTAGVSVLRPLLTLFISFGVSGFLALGAS